MHYKHRVASESVASRGQRQASGKRSRALGLLLNGVVEDHGVGACGRVQRLAGREAESAKSAVSRKAAWYLWHACLSFTLPALSVSLSLSLSLSLSSKRASLALTTDAARSRHASQLLGPARLALAWLLVAAPRRRWAAAARRSPVSPLPRRPGADALPHREGRRRIWPDPPSPSKPPADALSSGRHGTPCASLIYD